jgi:hypothetical protein
VANLGILFVTAVLTESKECESSVSLKLAFLGSLLCSRVHADAVISRIIKKKKKVQSSHGSPDALLLLNP